MKALITGASSGLGKDMAIYLSSLGYDIVAVARREKELDELGSHINTSYTSVVMDLSEQDNCTKLFNMLENDDLDIVINNAGFGAYGNFCEISLERELNMIDLNIKSLHILTKLFAKKFVRDGQGRILNVSSTAGFMMGPFLSAYYASKAYVLRYSEAVNEELRYICKNVRISVLCPGPVNTGFDSVAGVKNSLKGMNSARVAKYAVDKMLKNKRIIIPGFSNKLLVFLSRLVPSFILSKINYIIQKKKSK